MMCPRNKIVQCADPYSVLYGRRERFGHLRRGLCRAVADPPRTRACCRHKQHTPSNLFQSCEHVTLCNHQAKKPCAFGQRARKRPQRCKSRARSERENPGAKMQPGDLKKNSEHAGKSTRAEGRGKAQERSRSTRRPRKEGRGMAKEKRTKSNGRPRINAAVCIH